MPHTIVETRSYSKPRKCDVPVSNFVTFGNSDESPSGSDSSLDDFFPNGQSSKSSPCGGRENVDDKGIRSLSVLTNEDICNRRNEDRDLDFHTLNHVSGTYLNGGVINNCEDKEIRYSGCLTDSLPNNPLKSENMRILKDTKSEILGDFSDLLSSVPSPNKVSNGFSSGLDLLLDGFELSKSNDYEFYKSNSTKSKGDLRCEDSKKVNSNCPANNLKLNGNELQNNGTLSDILLSINFEDESMQKKNSSLPSPDSKLFFEDIKFPKCSGLAPELSKSESNSTADELKLNSYHSQKNGTLSDMFLSLSFEDDSAQNKLKSSLLSPDSKLRLEDIEVPISNGLISNLNNNEPQGRDTFSNILQSKENPAKCVSKSNIHDALFASLDFNVDNHEVPTSSISVPEPTGVKSSMHNQKNGEFSFFSISPENEFSDMVSKLKMDINVQDSTLEDSTTDDNSTGISMLDLFKSVNSDSCSSLSEYLSSESDGSLTNKSATERANDLCERLDIDLSSCVKTSDNTLNIIPSEKSVIEDCIDAREKDCIELQLGSFMIKTFPETDRLKRPRSNIKQGLFAKSLSCKPKKNLVLLQKVAKIKSELFERYFNRPFPDIEAKKSASSVKDLIVNQSNLCMISFHGRRVCSPNGLVDVKGD